jgi:hypothetical protein
MLNILKENNLEQELNKNPIISEIIQEYTIQIKNITLEKLSTVERWNIE